jgi:hypothetical protein
MGKENTGAYHAQKRRNRLDHRKSSRCSPGGENARAGRTVKRIPCPNRKSAPTDDLMQQVVQPASSKRRQPGLPLRLAATIDSLRRRSPHFRRVPPAVCSYVNAEMICIGDVGSPSA